MDLGRIDGWFKERRAGHSLPQPLYNDDQMFAFDMEAIYATSWLMAGLECELPRPASYVSLTIGVWPVLIVRDRAGTLRAFHNSCRHRGSMICAPGRGTGPKLVCPYHRWTYDLDGGLFAANRMADDFDKAEHGLKPLALETVAGVMFICLADQPPPFDDFREKMIAYAGPHNLQNTRLAFESVLVEAANWKLVMENGRECYHCATGHPELGKTFPVGMSKHFDFGEDATARRFEASMANAGLPMAPVEGSWWQLARFRLNDGCLTISADGQHLVKKLVCDINGGDIGSLRWAVDPHAFTHATGDYVFMFSAMPVGPNETHVVGKWYVQKDAVEGVDYDVEALSDLWTRTNLQDKELSENNQAGVRNRGYTPGPYSPDAEMLAQRFIDWYCDKARAYLDAHAG